MAFFLFTLKPLIAALYNASRTPFTLRTVVVIILGLLLGFRKEYNFPDSYVDRTSPWSFRPYANSNNIFLKYWTVADNACERTKRGIPVVCDFIVVGSGAGGSTVASRLSENPSYTVCLVEAGGITATESVIPQFFPFGVNNTAIWPYKAERVDSSSNAFRDGCGCIFGKQLGGTTGTNAMVYVCGNDRNFDHWESLGNTDWGYSSILPFQKKSENNLDNNIVGNGKYHSKDGPLTVSTLRNEDKLIKILQDGWGELKYKKIPDYNAQDYNGIVVLQATIKGGERENAWRAFMAPNTDRPNLRIFLNSHVSNITFSGKKATGVNLITSSSECPHIHLTATKEVIISGGTFGTTKIMLQSGIGRSADLSPHGIPQVADLNTGYNLMDHCYGMVFIALDPDVVGQNILGVMGDALNYLVTRTGPLSEIGSLTADAFINLTDPNAVYPDVQYAFYRFEKTQQFFGEILSNFNLKDEFVAKLLNVNQQYEIIATEVVILSPKSRGTVKLRSSDPLAHPKITTGYLTDPDGEDIKTVVGGINKLKELVKTKPFTDAKAKLVDLGLCPGYDLFSDDYIKCYIKSFTANLWHQSGTCKMGPSSDPDAVVDPTLKVYNVTNLRVCDASIFPTIPSGNTQCPTYMVGERCADFIKKDWASK